MPRKAKLTTSTDDEAYQRKRTEALKQANAKLDKMSETPPTYFKGTSRTLYKALVIELNKTGYISLQDKATFESFCLQYQVMREAYESIKTVGVVYEREGKIWKNPATQVFDSASAKLKTLGSELGLSPSSRSTLLELAQTDSGDAEESQILSMFGGN